MLNEFDGTESLTYQHEPNAGVVNESAIPYECLAEVRNVRETLIWDSKVAASLCDDDPDMRANRADKMLREIGEYPDEAHLAGYEVAHDADFAG